MSTANHYINDLAYLAAGSPPVYGQVNAAFGPGLHTEFSWSASPEGVKEIEALRDLWELHLPALKAVEVAMDAIGFGCPAGFPLSAHKADWNGYVFECQEPTSDTNQPQAIWMDWHSGEFCLPARWTPNGGLVIEEP